MIDLQATASVSDVSPIYQVRINDGGSDGGSNTDLLVSASNTGSVSQDQLETGLQAFGEALAVGSYRLVGITRVSVTETAL